MKKHLCSIIIIAFTLALIFGNLLAGAANIRAKDVTPYKYYTGILVEEGDTLWGFATKYTDHRIKDTSSYIKEIKSINGLTSDTIHAGELLIIVYYSNDYKP